MKTIKRTYCWKNTQRAQSSLEFAILTVIIVLALVAMQVYLKRGIQGNLRGHIESIGGQYDPEATSSEYNMSSVSNTTTVTTVESKEVGIDHCQYPPYCDTTTDLVTVATTRIETHYDNSTRSGWEVVGNVI